MVSEIGLFVTPIKKTVVECGPTTEVHENTRDVLKVVVKITDMRQN